MKRLLPLLAVAMTSLVLNGCAVFSNTRVQDGDSEMHRVSVVGIPIWMSTKPVKKTCCGNGK